MSTITYEQLADAVGGGSPGVRCRTTLEPLGGSGDKVFPPTYAVARDAQTRYAIETRRVDGMDQTCVVLDSVASQANRMELALLEACRSGLLALPLVSVDFRGVAELEDLDRISSLEASHRVFDAILRDSLCGDLLFRHSEVGRVITEAAPRNAAGLFRHAPTTLLFGGWDSTGPKGGRGAKYERCITSEIVAIGIDPGVKTASRIDPLGIELKAGPLYEAEDGSWTLDEGDARCEKNKPVLFGGTGAGGRPSEANHGNIAPSIDQEAGGVTADRIVAVTVLSYIALRRLRFPLDAAGQPFSDADRERAEVAARTALAALGLAATVLAFEEGFDLRSRCVLVPSGPLTFELLARTGAAPEEVTLASQEAMALVRRAGSEAADAGLPWMEEELLLQPTERLADLVRRSRVLAAVGSGE